MWFEYLLCIPTILSNSIEIQIRITIFDQYFETIIFYFSSTNIHSIRAKLFTINNKYTLKCHWIWLNSVAYACTLYVYTFIRITLSEIYNSILISNLCASINLISYYINISLKIASCSFSFYTSIWICIYKLQLILDKTHTQTHICRDKVTRKKKKLMLRCATTLDSTSIMP